MRKILAIVLLLVLGLPSALPLFAAAGGDADAGLPACCRRHGKHHCAMTEAMRAMGARADGSAEHGTPWMLAKGEVCPYHCGLLTQAHAPSGLLANTSLRLYAAVVAHPAVQAQTESRWRVARERARGKRGPPESQRFS